ncbi:MULTISPECIES: hypothetical protein [Jonquetella]|uniref:Uncharacterized protein n=1 Tax=Jonquetella anthropi DSM 22815 TaxID=885272 RepID=H0UL43_9BACT|nr:MULTISPECIES: hypothetical protein [Jonquetella]EEX47965.1 hypothetical protein GCWU000246_01279 [Jonquetella anthropi E3_33 E1]EHM13402.1 hypothetical protein JonanDRAFT_1031 [Jonquetella anthropi DSM 22815]ERL24932.1 hypothetical protein HMPREF1249_0405 [Jonquetella sp. BV3C21]
MKRFLAFIGAACLFSTTAQVPAQAVSLGGILGGIVGGYAVEKFSDQINKFINTVTFNKGLESEKYTKVVPILSLGSGARIGAAQVSGPKADGVQRCKAVVQLEADFKDKVRAKILVPIDQINVTKGFKRVHGVGVSAIIDVRL